MYERITCTCHLIQQCMCCWQSHTRNNPAIENDHDDVIKWRHFPRYWPFVQGIHRSPVNSPHKGQLRGALMFSMTCALINGWVNSGEAGDLRRHRTHHDVTVMMLTLWKLTSIIVGLNDNCICLAAEWKACHKQPPYAINQSWPGCPPSYWWWVVKAAIFYDH